MTIKKTLKAIAVAVAAVFGIQCSAQETELHRAAESGDLRWVQHVLNSGVYVDPTNGDRDTPLDLAAERGHADVVQVLLDAGARLKRGSHFGPARLCRAAVLQLLIDVLIDAGADPNVDDALHLAADCVFSSEAAEAVSVLLNAGADPNAVYILGGDTPLHLAADCKYKYDPAEVVLVLLNAGADPNAENSYGETPLDLAIEHGCADIAALLESAGAD